MERHEILDMLGTLQLSGMRAAYDEIVPVSAMEAMRKLARAATMSTLRVAAAQIAFHKSCVARTGAQHVYIKGVALAQQYSGTFGDRFCRDIDVLIASKDFNSVLTAAVSAGYRVLLDDDRSQFTLDRRDLDFLSRYADVVTLIGPDSIPIEVHRRLDKLSLNFDLEYAFASAEDVVLGGVTFKTLTKPLHFIYVCYHHSRHFWSRLHWLADLAAMIQSPDFDRRRVQELGDLIGIRPTIDAALEFQDLISRPGLWGASVPVETGGGQFLKACLVNLDGDLGLEVQLRNRMTLSDFMSAWQISPGRYNALWFNTWLRRLRPSVSPRPAAVRRTAARNQRHPPRRGAYARHSESSFRRRPVHTRRRDRDDHLGAPPGRPRLRRHGASRALPSTQVHRPVDG
jgi:hypothetical protein